MATLKPFGPSFAREIEAAGLLGLPWSYEPDGLIVGREHLTPEQDAALQAAIDAHDPVRADLLAYAADLRWRLEVGGITVGGVRIATDDRSKMMIVGARVAAQADPYWSTVWHCADGTTHAVDAADMVQISDAVQAHVNDSFATFAAVKAAIEAGTITTRSQIDAAFA